MLLHFALVLHFAAMVITFCGDYYILRRNIPQAEQRLEVSLELGRLGTTTWNESTWDETTMERNDRIRWEMS